MTAGDRAVRLAQPWFFVAIVAAVLAATAIAAPRNEGVHEVGYAAGAFYARVGLRYGMGERWLTSADGGRTWSRTPTAPPLASGRETWEGCADDGVCYRAQMASPTGSASGTRSQHLVERRRPGEQWRVEADLDTVPALVGMAVDPSDSSRAVAISWAYGFYREPTGVWKELDLVELASDPEWVRVLVLQAGSPTATLLIGLVLSVLGWLLLPTLASKWVAQVITLFVAGMLPVVGLLLWGMFQAMPIVRAHLIWAVVTVAVVVAVARRRRAAGQTDDSGFDPPGGAR